MPAPTITPLPAAPSRSTDPATFATEADAFVGALPTFGTQANAQAAYLDALAIDVDAAAALGQAAIANFKGVYAAGTTYQIGESVLYNNFFWLALTVNIGVTPVEGANWKNVSIVDGNATTIRMKRDIEANRLAVTPNAGEFYFTTDNKKVFIGDGTTAGGVSVGGAVAFEQSIKDVNYTLVLQDAGKQIFHPESDVVVRTYTIPANSVVPFPIGTVVQFAVDNLGRDVNVAINSDTLVLGSGVTGTIRVDPGNILTAIKITATKWLANYEYQFPYQTPEMVVVTEASTASQFINLYPWNSVTATFGTRYSTPAGVVSGNYTGVRIAPNGTAVAAALSASPFVIAWALSSAGYGAKFSNPATLPAGSGNDVAWHPEMNALAVAHGASGVPGVSVYPWSASGFGVRYANAGTPVNGEFLAVAFHPSGNAIFMANASTPFLHAYAWNSATGFGTKYANPSTLPTDGNAAKIATNPAGDAVAVSNLFGAERLNVYAWNNATGFGTRFSNPATIPTGGCTSVAWHPSGGAIAVTQASTSPFVSTYPWSVSGFGTRHGGPGSGTPTNRMNGVAFSGDGNTICMVGEAPFMRAWAWNNATGFGAVRTDPATLPGSISQKVDFGFV